MGSQDVVVDPQTSLNSNHATKQPGLLGFHYIFLVEPFVFFLHGQGFIDDTG